MIDFRQSLIVFTGGYNAGKTTAAFTATPPDRFGRVFCHDGEGSGNRFIEQAKARGLEIGYYNNLDDRWRSMDLPGSADLLGRIAANNLPWVDATQRTSMEEFYQYIVDDLNNNLVPGKFDTYIFDPIARLEAGMQAFVLNNKDKTGWKRKGFGEMWWGGYYPLYRGILSAIFDRGVNLIVFTAHLGNPWTEEGAIPGKVKPKAKPELYKLSQFYCWLVQEPTNADGAPAGVVLKERLGTVGVEANDWVVERKLPRRIPHFTWADVARYLDEGCDLEHPAPGEVPTTEEQEMIDEALTDKQMQLMILRAETEKAKALTATSMSPVLDEGIPVLSPQEQARQMAARGKSPPEIAQELKHPLPIVLTWL